MNILNKLERKFGRFYISNLMLYIIIGTGIVFAFQFLFPTLPIYSLLMFDRSAILHGQIWRLISFIFVPGSSGPIGMLFWLYLYWLFGTDLERYWGGFRFNVYYFTGVLLAIIAGFITGYATNEYLNLSLFLAIAILDPNSELLLFFFIPVKMKWMAWVYLVLIAANFIPLYAVSLAISEHLSFGYFVQILNSYWDVRISIILSLLNIALFFGGDFFRKVRDKFRYRKVRKNFKKNIKMTTFKDDE